MANEKRLIDALELSDRLGKLDAQNRNDGLLMADNELWKMPVVDAVEVVRCRDCVYCKDNKVCFRKSKHGGCVDSVHANFYCAAGKRRKENATN